MIQELVLFMLIYFGSYDATVTAYSSATVDSRWEVSQGGQISRLS